jgi:hypothetical protein
MITITHLKNENNSVKLAFVSLTELDMIKVIRDHDKTFFGLQENASFNALSEAKQSELREFMNILLNNRLDLGLMVNQLKGFADKKMQGYSSVVANEAWGKILDIPAAENTAYKGGETVLELIIEDAAQLIPELNIVENQPAVEVEPVVENTISEEVEAPAEIETGMVGTTAEMEAPVETVETEMEVEAEEIKAPTKKA